VNLQLKSLTVYRAILSDETVTRFARALDAAQSSVAESFCTSYGAFIQSLSQVENSLNFGYHLEKLLKFDDNAFSRAASRKGNEPEQALRNAAAYDLSAIASIAAVSAKQLKQVILAHAESQELELISTMPEYISLHTFFQVDAANLLSQLEAFYRQNGYGVFAQYGAFRWSSDLIGVANPDPVRLTELKSYEYERGLVAANTKDFVEGRGGGNLLLYGDRGTGKSSTIKALANEYRASGLRIVEVTKGSIPQFPAIMERLREVPLRFILFLDDLSFSTDDESFSALKSVLEGGVVARPEN